MSMKQISPRTIYRFACDSPGCPNTEEAESTPHGWSHLNYELYVTGATSKRGNLHLCPHHTQDVSWLP